jgi:acetylornithine deacetylase/succinyl-diaminopimelate desuccinylase-like protein
MQNRGVVRLEVSASGRRGHSGAGPTDTDLTERLVQARTDMLRLMGERLTLSSPDGWQSQVSFPYLNVGTPGVFNITPDRGLLGAEIRPIPQDDARPVLEAVESYCQARGLDLQIIVMENGIACDPGNLYLQALLSAIRASSGAEPVLGRKLPGTSARFAPGGQGVVWGQSGIGPHSREERHYIPSILPYYRALEEYSRQLHAATAIDKSGRA